MAYVRKRSKGKYQGYFNRKGKQHSVGIYPTKAEALTAALEKEKGKIVRDGRPIPFPAYAMDYVSELENADGTQLAYEMYMRLHIIPFFADYSVQEIDVADVGRWASGLGKRQHLAPASCRKVFSLFRRMMEQAVEEGVIQRNPALPTMVKRLPKMKKRKNNYLTADEVMLLADHIEPRYRVAILTMGIMGYRFGEMAGLRKIDVDLEAGVIHKMGAMKENQGTCTWEPHTKTDNQYSLPMPDTFLKEMRRHMLKFANDNGSEYVFTGPKGKHLRRHWNRRHFKPAVAAAGLPLHTKPHDLRHTCISLMLDAGVPLHDVAKWVGHEDIRTTMQYGGGYEKEHETAATVDHVFGAAETGSSRAAFGTVSDLGSHRQKGKNRRSEAQ